MTEATLVNSQGQPVMMGDSPEVLVKKPRKQRSDKGKPRGPRKPKAPVTQEG